MRSDKPALFTHCVVEPLNTCAEDGARFIKNYCVEVAIECIACQNRSVNLSTSAVREGATDADTMFVKQFCVFFL